MLTFFGAGDDGWESSGVTGSGDARHDDAGKRRTSLLTAAASIIVGIVAALSLLVSADTMMCDQGHLQLEVLQR